MDGCLRRSFTPSHRRHARRDRRYLPPGLVSSRWPQEDNRRIRRGRITSDAGVMLLGQAERRLGLADKIAPVIADPRNPLLITHSLASCQE